MGRQFSHNDVIRAALEHRLHLGDSVSIVGLSLGWPNSEALDKAYDPIRKNGWGRQRVQWAPVLQISGALGSTEEFTFLLEFILSDGVGYVWEFLDFRVPTAIARLKQDSALASYRLKKMRNSPTSDHKASLPRLLVAPIGLNDEINDLCETYYAEQCAKGQLSESGLDMSAGQIRPVAHSLLDVLVPRTY